MCGAVAGPQIVNFNRQNLEESFCSRLRKTKSLQALSELVLELPSDKARAANLRRRISSVEDLMVLAAREDSKTAMAQLAESDPQPAVAEPTSATPPASSKETEPCSRNPNEPCTDPNCDKACGIRAALGNALQVTTIAVEEAETAAKAEDDSVPESAFQSAFASAGRSADSSPFISITAPPGTGSLIEALKPQTHPSVLGIAPASTGSSPNSGFEFPRRKSICLDDRRSSCDLGHVAPPSTHLGQGSAAVELFYRLNHARQTVDYVKRQAAQYAPLNCDVMSVWEALERLNSLREYESALVGGDQCDADMPLLEHALQTAEACRLAFPEHEWMAVVGLIHGLGKLLAHATFGGEPQWAVCGESFPVGCRFHPSVVHSQYFQANPDRRRRAYATATGVYQPGCGLNAVCMSWSGAEYLYMVLARNRTALPPEALFLIRYQKFAALLRPGQPYGELLSAFDKKMLPMLSQFRRLAAYKRVDLPGRLEGDELHAYYDALLSKYIPQGKLRW